MNFTANNPHSMKKLSINTEFELWNSREELAEADRRLLELAIASRANSYSPYSRFQVGAAVLLENGEMVGGSNYENASYPLCICAEQTVLTTAANRFPNVPAVAIAVTVKNPDQVIDRPGPPCGGCRQVICETEVKNRRPMRVILQGETGPVYCFCSGGDLLPLAFDQTYLLKEE
jgi:cytidine deaminase